MGILKYNYYTVIFVALIIPQIFTIANAENLLTWSDRKDIETEDRGWIEDAPFVKIGGLGLSRFANMQRIELQNTLKIEDGDGFETLYVFRVWQGGATQGEQLMLVSLKASGVDIIGPYEQDFETLEIGHLNSESAPEFYLKGGDGEVLAALEYYVGQLFKR